MVFKAEGICPKCKSKGKQVSKDSMLHHVDDISYIKEQFDYYICKNALCEVVYFNILNEYLYTHLNKEVGYKSFSTSNANICYCYNIKKQDLNEHTIGIIETKMDEYPCACEVRNPYGSCCRKEIKKLMKEKIERG